MKDVVIAIDIGGTSMKGAVIEENGNILYKDNFDVDPKHTTDEHKKVIADFAQNMNFYAEPDTLCYTIHHGYKVKEVQVEMKEREGGESYFANPFKSIKFMLGVLLSIIFVQW